MNKNDHMKEIFGGGGYSGKLIFILLPACEKDVGKPLSKQKGE